MVALKLLCPDMGLMGQIALAFLKKHLLFFLFCSDAFAKLLESGDLHMSSIKVDGISISFQHLLAKICFHHHFSGEFSLMQNLLQNSIF